MTKKIESGEELNRGLLRALENQSKKKQKVRGEPGHSGEDHGVDTVDLNLGRAINTELNPETMAAERKEKVARLKELVQSGKYNVSSDDVALAVGEEIVLEILSNQDR